MQESDLSGWPCLEDLRRSRKISLEMIAAETRIRLDYLSAIENGDFGKLPGGIYTTSYIRQYARVIDYPEQDLLTLFISATMKPLDPPVNGQDPQRRTRPRLLRWLGSFVL